MRARLPNGVSHEANIVDPDDVIADSVFEGESAASVRSPARGNVFFVMCVQQVSTQFVPYAAALLGRVTQHLSSKPNAATRINANPMLPTMTGINRLCLRSPGANAVNESAKQTNAVHL